MKRCTEQGLGENVDLMCPSLLNQGMSLSWQSMFTNQNVLLSFSVQSFYGEVMLISHGSQPQLLNHAVGLCKTRSHL